MEIPQSLAQSLDAYAKHLVADYNRWSKSPSMVSGVHRVEFEKGSKYVKVVHSTSWNGSPGQRSVHSFVVLSRKDGQFKFGDILKAASWKAPAKNFKRGNVLKGDFAGISWAGC